MKKLLVTIITIFTLGISQQAVANITLSKNRLFFDQNQRADALQLRNTGGNRMNFTASLRLVEMTEQGTLRTVKELDKSALKLVRFSPKRGTVEPGGKQVIRFSVRRPRSLEAGEYRAVLNVETSMALDRPEAVTLNTRLAYNMPIIVRQGETVAATELSKPRLVTVGNTPHIELWQTLDGNRSLFGNFIVTDKDNNEVGILNGIAVYPPLTQRKVLIPLDSDVQSGTVNIQYQEVAEYGGDLSAATSLQL